MSQIKIYGLKDNIDNIKQKLSKSIHSTIVEILSFPKDKKYHRFISLNKDLDISVNDIEICIIESKASNWGFRGMTGDEIQLNNKVGV
jgi:hypothetical protein